MLRLTSNPANSNNVHIFLRVSRKREVVNIVEGHIIICFFKEQRKKSVAAISPGIPITFSNTNHKLTTYMKATKVTNIQIRLLVEESQQLNSKK